jgi:hypothetical protein
LLIKLLAEMRPSDPQEAQQEVLSARTMCVMLELLWEVRWLLSCPILPAALLLGRVGDLARHDPKILCSFANP